MTFNLYTPATTQNGSTLLSTSHRAVSLVGSTATATSAGYTATATGTDYWVATYNGDSNNTAVTSGTACEPVTHHRRHSVDQHQPARRPRHRRHVRSPTGHGHGRYNAAPATVTFNLYNNATGTGTPLLLPTPRRDLTGSGPATSAGYTATATGTDYWVATYNGDSNNIRSPAGPPASR